MAKLSQDGYDPWNHSSKLVASIGALERRPGHRRPASRGSGSKDRKSEVESDPDTHHHRPRPLRRGAAGHREPAARQAVGAAGGGAGSTGRPMLFPGSMLRSCTCAVCTFRAHWRLPVPGSHAVSSFIGSGGAPWCAFACSSPPSVRPVPRCSFLLTFSFDFVLYVLPGWVRHPARPAAVPAVTRGAQGPCAQAGECVRVVWAVCGVCAGGAWWRSLGSCPLALLALARSSGGTYRMK